MKKLSCLLSILFILNFNIISFADTTKGVNSESDEEIIDIDNIKKLTVDEAFEIAVKYNKEIIELEEDLPFVKEDYDDALEDLPVNPDSYYSLKAQIAELKNTLDNYDDTITQSKDILKYNIQKLFVDIVNAENSIKIDEANAEIAKKEFEIAQLKYNKGMLSKADYDTAYSDYNKKLNSLENSKIDLDNLYIDINRVIGIDLKKQYSIILELNYKKLDDIDIDEKVQSGLENNLKLREQKQSLDIYKYEYSIYDTYTDYYDKVSKEKDIHQAERNIEETQSNFNESMTKIYKDIMSAENSDEKYKNSLEGKENELEILKIKFSLGKATQLEIDKKIVEIDTLKNDILKNQYEHELLVMKFENSNLTETN